MLIISHFLVLHHHEEYGSGSSLTPHRQWGAVSCPQSHLLWSSPASLAPPHWGSLLSSLQLTYIFSALVGLKTGNATTNNHWVKGHNPFPWSQCAPVRAAQGAVGCPHHQVAPLVHAQCAACCLPGLPGRFLKSCSLISPVSETKTFHSQM